MAALNLTVWKQQKSVLNGTLVGSNYAILAVGTLTFKHECKSNGEYIIDITDIVRVFGDGTTFEVVFYDADGNVLQTDEYAISVAGNIDPNRQIIPNNESIDIVSETYDIPASGIVMPPSVLLPKLFAPLLFESYDVRRVGDVWLVSVNGVTSLYRKNMSLDVNAGDSVAIVRSNEDRSILWQTHVSEMLCGKRYACVEWVGRTGIRKRATWEVRGVTDEQAEAQEMLNVQNAFDVRMGVLQKLTLSLAGLNAYAYWYYSDIVTSSDVRVALSADDYNEAEDRLSENARVAVLTKSVVQKDGNGGAFSTLNIEIKYKRYDRI